MPRRSLLTLSERESLLAFPETLNELIQHYTFSESDIAAIQQRRGDHNRLGFAIQICYLVPVYKRPYFYGIHHKVRMFLCRNNKKSEGPPRNAY